MYRKQHRDLIGEILDASGEKDDFDYKGKGKPLPKAYMKMDTFQHFQKIAKDAGYLPPWLELQKEISELVHTCKTEEDAGIINEKISEYNKVCPNTMQKGPISLNELGKAKRIW